MKISSRKIEMRSRHVDVNDCGNIARMWIMSTGLRAAKSLKNVWVGIQHFLIHLSSFYSIASIWCSRLMTRIEFHRCENNFTRRLRFDFNWNHEIALSKFWITFLFNSHIVLRNHATQLKLNPQLSAWKLFTLQINLKMIWFISKIFWEFVYCFTFQRV